jgi:hypothetical protein
MYRLALSPINSLLLFLMIVLFVLFPAKASGYSVRLDFAGEVTIYTDMVTGSRVDAYIGTPFSGYLIYRVDGAERYAAELNPGNQYVSGAESDSGCTHIANGECNYDYGSDAPVLTTYEFNYLGQSFRPYSDSFGLSEYSDRLNVRFNNDIQAGEYRELWNVLRSQLQYVYSNAGSGYFYTNTWRVLSIDVFDYGLLSNDLDNLYQGFDLTPSTLFANLGFLDYRPLTAFCPDNSTPCDFQYDTGSFELEGRLTSATFTVVPAGSSGAFLILGLVIMARFTRHLSP